MALTHVRRTLLLTLLLAIYLASSVRSLVGDWMRRDAFDPFLPAARAVELRIAEGRFAEAMPLAADLERAYPDQPDIAFWQARIHHGLNDPRQEAAAWERYVAASPAPAEACPAVAEAYARAGQPADSLRAYERCAEWAPDEAEALIDLAEAYALNRREGDACAAFERAAAIDPTNPAPARRLQAMRGGAR